VGPVTIRIFDTRPPAFWVAMGPLFASASVRRELPYLRDEIGRIWVVAFDIVEVVAGFAAMAIRDDLGTLSSLWVRRDLRGTSGVAAELLDVRLRYLASVGVRTVEVTANGLSRPRLQRAGFIAQGVRGQYTVMTKELQP
jgi:hypothetical protein